MVSKVNVDSGAESEPVNFPLRFEVMGAALADDGVKYALSSYVDIHGIPKAKVVPIAHFDRMMRGSELYTGAALDGLGQMPSDDELALVPDPNAVTQLPWRPEYAWAPGNLTYHEEPWHMCTRGILGKQLERAASHGLKFNLGIECEIYVVRRDGNTLCAPNPNDTMDKAAYDVLNALEYGDWWQPIIQYMDQMGWDVHSFDHEDANGQFEFDFAYSDALTTADRFVLWRLMCKEISRRHGFEATYMAKPYSDRTGTGAHLNMSMESISTGENVFKDADDPRGLGLSKLAYQFIGGILSHAAAVTTFSCPTVNSYKRLIKRGSRTGYTWAPIFACYGGNNRTNMLRVPNLRPHVDEHGKSTGKLDLSSARIECRVADATMNPYLSAAAILSAGLDGIERDLDPGDPQQGNLYEVPEDELKARNVHQLPRTLQEAVAALSADSYMSASLGKGIVDAFVELKSNEWWDYHNSISQWELDQYLTKY